MPTFLAGSASKNNNEGKQFVLQATSVTARRKHAAH